MNLKRFGIKESLPISRQYRITKKKKNPFGIAELQVEKRIERLVKLNIGAKHNTADFADFVAETTELCYRSEDANNIHSTGWTHTLS